MGLNAPWRSDAWSSASNITSYYVSDNPSVGYAAGPTYVASPVAEAAPSKPKPAIDWLKGRIDEITSAAWTEVPA